VARAYACFSSSITLISVYSSTNLWIASFAPLMIFWGRRRFHVFRELRGMVELLGGRAAVRTVLDWPRGRRRSPRWAIEVLLTRSAKRERGQAANPRNPHDCVREVGNYGARIDRFGHLRSESMRCCKAGVRKRWYENT
jgi:hypothetical protein